MGLVCLLLLVHARRAGSSSAAQLRTLLARPGAVQVPGVHDALSAKIFSEAGAECLFLSGFGVSAAKLGVPDAGILAYPEMEEAARACASAARGVPLIVDGDTGYGGAANVRRTVRGFAAAGAAAVTIEDQRFPKRCTFAAGAGVRVVDRDAATRRVRAALRARDEALDLDGNDVLVIARTDCRRALGLAEAIERCVAFEALGADVVYAEALESRREYEELRAALEPATRTMLAQLQPDATSRPSLSLDEISALGFDLSLLGVTALQAVVAALRAAAEDVLEDGASPSACSFDDVKRVVGFGDLAAFEGEYACE